jgi:hypothetical protein
MIFQPPQSPNMPLYYGSQPNQLINADDIVFIPTDLLSGNYNKDALQLGDHQSSVFFVAPRAAHGDGRDREMNMNMNAQTQRADSGPRDPHGIEASSPIARVGRLQ